MDHIDPGSGCVYAIIWDWLLCKFIGNDKFILKTLVVVIRCGMPITLGGRHYYNSYMTCYKQKLC